MGNHTFHRDKALVELEKLLLSNTGNLTALQTIRAPVFVGSPEIRGSTTILWSCIITLVACIYTALHLNVPANTQKMAMLGEKLKWVLIGLIAPEVVLYLASSQFLDARRLSKELTSLWQQKKHVDGVEMEVQGEDKFQEVEEEDPVFDIKYGFFVAMGGLEIPIKDIQHYTDRLATRGTLESGNLRLSVNGVLQLARLGHFLTIPSSGIDDKSKADTFEKFLIMTQVIWMATQCTVRKSYGLPICLLEIHTLVHVVCALVMFVFWIKKPKDVTDPMPVEPSRFRNIIALMVQEQFHFRRSEEIIFYPRSRIGEVRPEQSAFVWAHQTDLTRRKRLTDEDHRVLPIEWVRPKGNSWTLNVGEVLSSGLGIVGRSASWQVERFQRRVLPDWFDDSPYDRPSDIPSSVWITEWVDAEPTRPTIDLRPQDIVRWERVVDAIESIEGRIQQPELFHHDYQQIRYPDQHFHDAFTRSAGNFQYTGDSQVDPDQILSFIFSSPILLILLLVLPAVYGGIHFLASSQRFPTEVELLLWRISSFDIMLTMPVFFAVTYIGSAISRQFFEYESLGESSWAMFYKFPGHLMIFALENSRSFMRAPSTALGFVTTLSFAIVGP
ncbi:hypothetical protein G7Z17_g4608 [Cylindrodendrum hubeiense]|uniref:Uncharacterized protein n=1 Tax=Cylindrodendrum hubeiense TaxID=595255 RepID=A0A9P5HFQ2_9HYPO|nr:hypothetical protein G7Z17_g4608 [Cylindrodendrum hubeiense]